MKSARMAVGCVGAILAVLFSVSMGRAAGGDAADNGRITVVFRYDDYCNGTPIKLEKKIIKDFKKVHLRCDFAVIPFDIRRDSKGARAGQPQPLSSEKIALMRQALKEGIVEVALHGYTHVARPEKAKIPTEIKGLDYAVQLEKISAGKNYLEKIFHTKVSIFIPPWNTYDIQTLRCLEKTGFKTISAQRDTEVMDETSAVVSLPRTCGLPRLRATIKSARRSSRVSPVIVVLFHCFDFRGLPGNRDDIKYNDFKKLLSWVASQKDVCVRFMSEAAKEVNYFTLPRLPGSLTAVPDVYRDGSVKIQMPFSVRHWVKI